MTLTQTWSGLDGLDAAERSRVATAKALADTLYELVARLEGEPRRAIIQLRRDLHNDRKLEASALALAESRLDSATAAELREWSERRSEAARELELVERTYEHELDAARRRLGAIAGDEDFLKGIQLSGQALHHSVLEYVESARSPDRHPRNKHVRKTESTLVRFAYRMALRTTPFASFTEIGAEPWRAAPVRAVAHGATRERLVRLNRSLLVWMASVLRKLDGADRLFSLRLNDTLVVRGGAVHAFTRGMDGDARSYWSESFVSLPTSQPLDLVLGALSQGARPRVEIVEQLTAVGLPAAPVGSFLDKLVESGLLHQDLNLPDQTRAYAHEVATRLMSVGTPVALQCAEIFASMVRLEAGFGAASAAERGQIVRRIYEQVESFTELCDVRSPAALSESPVWEDVGTRATSHWWDPALLERNIERFSRLQRIIPLFDDMGPQRLGLYRWFARHYGEDGRCDDLLEVYQRFASQAPRQVSEVMQAEDDPHAQRVIELRGRFLRRLYDALEQSGEATTAWLDERFFDEAIDELDAWVPHWDSAAYWLQLVPASEERAACIVLNNVATGHGAYYSRFCELFEARGKGEWSLGAAIRAAIGAENPRQADITAVFGINVNLHPHLSPLELVYPGAVPTTGTTALSVRDLGISADPATRRLRLYTRSDGLPLELVPLNFLFPDAAPLLYRFLCALGSSHNVRLRLWNRVKKAFAGDRTCFPRLQFGELVLERRSWFVPSTELSFLGDGTRLPSLELLRSAERWRLDRGLPRESFIRGMERAPKVRPDESWVDVTRQWALAARSARRKPQYLDFRNPFLLRLLASAARSSSEGIIVSECLPPTSIYADDQGASSAEELLVEVTTKPSRGERDR